MGRVKLIAGSYEIIKSADISNGCEIRTIYQEKVKSGKY